MTKNIEEKAVPKLLEVALQGENKSMDVEIPTIGIPVSKSITLAIIDQKLFLEKQKEIEKKYREKIENEV